MTLTKTTLAGLAVLALAGFASVSPASAQRAHPAYHVYQAPIVQYGLPAFARPLSVLIGVGY